MVCELGFDLAFGGLTAAPGAEVALEPLDLLGRPAREFIPQLLHDFLERRAQNLALAVRTEKEARPACGYGVFTADNETQYYLFYNTSVNCVSVKKYYEGRVTAGRPDPLPGDVSQLLPEGPVIILPAGVTITRLPAGLGTSDKRNSVYFGPPDPTTYIAGNSDPNTGNPNEPTYRAYTLSSSGGAFSRKVTIYLNGRIEIQ